MFTTPETQLFKSQYDILFETTETNPYLKASARASKNKALKTSDKRIIQAINENKSRIDSINSTVISTLNAQNAIIGNQLGDPNLKAAFDATGYANLSDGIIKLDTKTGKMEKQIMFVFPKVNTSTVWPELYIPFDMTILSVAARFSELDNTIANISNDIKIVLQHTDNANPTNFTTFKEVSIAVGQSFVSETLNTTIDLPSGLIKAVIQDAPENLKNINVAVIATKRI